ncbi:Vacuolar protein sorting-associated protein 52 [Malassezia sp. CBS 17886]|nr:Vacuolar protein sorting-associated protein 52 [Malassezia sp. CBS 17886]
MDATDCARAAADLAPRLAQATRAAGEDVRALCEGGCARAAAAEDARWEVRRPALEALAEHRRTARRELDAMQQSLEDFYTQLSSTYRHIAELQRTSAGLTARLDAKVAAEESLAAWLRDAAVPPPAVQRLREQAIDTDVGAWVHALACVERSLHCTGALVAQRGAPAAGAAVSTLRAVAEACRAVAVAKIRPHLLALLQPIRTSLATTLPVLQFSVLLPHHQPLYQFLATHAPRVAGEVQLAYVNAARLYYETAFRRYVRELRRVLARWSEPAVAVGDAWRHDFADDAPGGYAPARLAFADARAQVPVILAYMGEDPGVRCAPEHVFHTFALVFADTACAEYAFLARFFGALSADGDSLLWLSDAEDAAHATRHLVTREVWRQVMEPGAALFAELGQAVLAVQPAPLLGVYGMAVLATELLALAESRHCLPPELEAAWRRFLLNAWPLVMRALDAEVDALKALSVGARRAARGGGFLEMLGAASMSPSTTDLAPHAAARLRKVCGRRALLTRLILTHYVALFAAVTRRESVQQAMLLGGLVRMRTELQRLVSEYAGHGGGRPRTLATIQVGRLQYRMPRAGMPTTGLLVSA